MTRSDDPATIFEAHRSVLRGIAYRMTGSLADADDLLQEAYLRWRRATTDQHDPIEKPEAYLKQVVTRLCLDHLSSARLRREQYVGPWLPEPLLDASAAASDGAGELAHDISIAFLLTLQRLSPLERAAFLLKDVFDLDYAEIATALGRDSATCRKLAERARSHVQSQRPRFTPSRDEAERLVGAFNAALATGDLGQLMSVLATDCVVTTDGGGRVRAALKPIRGRNKVARFFLGMAKKYAARKMVATPTVINGLVGACVEFDGALDQVIAFEVADGAIQAIYTVRNPDKLTGVATKHPLQ